MQSISWPPIGVGFENPLVNNLFNGGGGGLPIPPSHLLLTDGSDFLLTTGDLLLLAE